jgi:hypothetical protein
MSSPRYQAARDVAPRVQAHFDRFLTEAAVTTGAVVPDLTDIEAILDAGFWASLKREENYLPRVSLALLPATHAARPLRFDNALPLSPVGLVRVAAAAERPGMHLGVWRMDGELRVWGTTRDVPPHCVVVEVAGPGLLVVKHQREDGGKYVNVVVLEGDRIKMIDDTAKALPDCPSLVTSLLGFASTPMRSRHVDILVELAVSMRAHRRGGTMLVVPRDSDGWRESIVQPMSYAVNPKFAALADVVSRADAEHATREWQDEMDETVSMVAGLTAIDGAALINDRYELLAFGAKIARRDGSPLVEQTMVTEPIEGGEADILHPSRLGGTRHLSAAQFVSDQPDSIAMVASQDGRFTIFAWSVSEKMVHAHRVEALLL